jgi:hypothetical protein
MTLSGRRVLEALQVSCHEYCDPKLVMLPMDLPVVAQNTESGEWPSLPSDNDT